jgi:Fe2+ transport system protein FeoA
MVLSLVPQGQRVRVMDIAANQRVRQRLAALGITRGVDMTVLQDNGGALLVAVRGTRLALERRVAHQIRVQCAREAS